MIFSVLLSNFFQFYFFNKNIADSLTGARSFYIVFVK